MRSPGNPITRLIRLGSVAGKFEHHRVAALDVSQAEAVRELVDENPLLVGEARHHAGAFDFYRLVNENNRDYRDEDGEGQVADPGERIPDTGAQARFRQFLFEGRDCGDLWRILLGHPYLSINRL
jgi:hypothetical protein